MIKPRSIGPPPAATASYAEFVARKHLRARPTGFDVPVSALLPALFDWQARVVQWALASGKAALFEDCGLGKTPQQLAWASAVARHTGKRVLIHAPLTVAQQTVHEGEKFGVRCVYAQSSADIDQAAPSIVLTNYDRADAFDPSHFAGVVLDESSILKNFVGVTKKLLVSRFADTPFRLCCTATPAPNDHMELGNHAEFLGVMPANEMLMRWFINDTMNFGTYRLKKHAAADFWRWMASWAVSVSKPSDVGGDDTGYVLPPLDIRVVEVETDPNSIPEGQLFPTQQVSATSLWRERASNLDARVQALRALIDAEPDEPWVIWCETNEEADAITRGISDVVEVRGSHAPRVKEARLLSFARGESSRLATKADIAGFGMNWQHCARQAYLGFTFSFERTYQALRRSWRFGQQRPVRAFFIHGEGEASVWKAIRDKQAAHAEMHTAMVRAMRESGLLKPQRLQLRGLASARITQVPTWLHTKTA